MQSGKGAAVLVNQSFLNAERGYITGSSSISFSSCFLLFYISRDSKEGSKHGRRGWINTSGWYSLLSPLAHHPPPHLLEPLFPSTPVIPPWSEVGIMHRFLLRAVENVSCRSLSCAPLCVPSRALGRISACWWNIWQIPCNFFKVDHRTQNSCRNTQKKHLKLL